MSSDVGEVGFVNGLYASFRYWCSFIMILVFFHYEMLERLSYLNSLLEMYA